MAIGRLGGFMDVVWVAIRKTHVACVALEGRFLLQISAPDTKKILCLSDVILGKFPFNRNPHTLIGSDTRWLGFRRILLGRNEAYDVLLGWTLSPSYGAI